MWPKRSLSKITLIFSRTIRFFFKLVTFDTSGINDLHVFSYARSVFLINPPQGTKWAEINRWKKEDISVVLKSSSSSSPNKLSYGIYRRFYLYLYLYLLLSTYYSAYILKHLPPVAVVKWVSYARRCVVSF